MITSTLGSPISIDQLKGQLRSDYKHVAFIDHKLEHDHILFQVWLSGRGRMIEVKHQIHYK